MAFDISTLEPTPSAFCHLKHPKTKEPLFSDGAPVGFTVFGPDSELFTRLQRIAANETMRRGRKKTVEELDEQSLDFLVAITQEPVNFFLDQRLCGPDDIRAIYARFRFIREQVDAFVMDRGNFIKG